jgi:hypothetical protein
MSALIEMQRQQPGPVTDETEFQAARTTPAFDCWCPMSECYNIECSVRLIRYDRLRSPADHGYKIALLSSTHINRRRRSGIIAIKAYNEGMKSWTGPAL